ncbi:YcaO-like family protein [Cellulosimicrobium marinum]|uniref:YcaO-like family protein n=1 Tax=Cellulosimicrobium marinum TaxID=1638992 RepID=UPI001E58F26D|nr:YcaO-like family protein [Cellulosimicrobium marinum]MCB7135623.1 YcaO-like family protein [Cellulosimicrobium marinum]
MSRHAHVAALGDGLVVTVGERVVRVAVSAARLGDDGVRDDVRAALEGRLGPLATWPPDEPSEETVWWWGGAWYACRAADADLARRVVRTGAPDAATAQAWDARALDLGPDLGPDLGLQVRPDPDRATALAASRTVAPGSVVRCADGRTSLHAVAPWPDVDPVSGVARAVLVRPHDLGLPTAFRHVQAVLPRTELGWPTWQADRLAQTGVLVGPDDDAGRLVHDAALDAAVAHLGGPWTGAAPVRTASVADLAGAGERFVAPERLAVVDPAVVADPRSPLVALDPARPLAWVRGHRVRDDAPTWVPLRFAHTVHGVVADQPPSAFHNLAGAAAATTRDEAVHRALGHVVSHDAVARWWRRADAPPPAEIAVPDALLRLWDDATVELALHRLPGPPGWDVVLAVVRDTVRGLRGLGHAAGPLAEHAAGPAGEHRGAVDVARRAAADALVQLTSARDLARADSRIRNAVDRGLGVVAGLLDHRPSRDHLDDVPLLDDVAGGRVRPRALDPLVHVQVGLDPRVVEHLETRLGRGPRVPAGVALPAGDAARPDEAADPGEAVRVDIAPPVLGPGRAAVRVLVAGALRLEPAAFPVVTSAEGVPETVPYPGW